MTPARLGQKEIHAGKESTQMQKQKVFSTFADF
jgi:hypothetical protein